MKLYFQTLALLIVCAALISVKAPAQAVGTYWTFQLEPDAGNSGGTYSSQVTASTLPGGTPSFSAAGSGLTNFGNFGQTFTAFDGSVWDPGRAVTWNADRTGGSTGNRFQISIDSLSASDFKIRFKYRNNGTTTASLPVTAFTAFEYNIGGGFVAVPGANLALANNQSYDNIWNIDLSPLDVIEDIGPVTLRWSLPDFDQGSLKQLRVDDLQITATRIEQPRPRYLPEGNYNVLFVAFDDLKANFGPFVTPELAAAMPEPVTPHLDSLSSTGMAFTRAYCQQAVCWASRVSLLTGCRPDTTKVWDDGPNLRNTMPGIITLPQYFANRGYSVAGYGKIFDPRSTPAGQDAALSWPDGQGDRNASRNFFEDGKWQVEQATPSGSDRGKLFATDIAVTNFWVTPNRPVNPNTDYSDGLNATDSINKLNTFASSYTNTGKPFFLAIGFKRPHLPFNAPKTFWDLHEPAEIDLTGYTGTRTFPSGTLSFTGANYEIASYGNIPDSTVNEVNVARQLIHGYLAATSFADYQFGRVLTALNANPAVAANTIIVAFGDHGWHLGDHNGFWAKHSCYENSARAPLIIRAPGMDTIGTAGKTCETPVEFVDIYPTLVDLASQPVPPQPAGLELQGHSLRPLLEDPEQPWKKGAFTQYQRYISGTGIARPGNGMGYSIRTKRFRYTEWWRTQTTLVDGNSLNRDVKLYSTPEFVELYDTLNDPKETVNQATNPAYATHRTELSAALAGGYGWETASVAPPASFPTDFPAWQAVHVEPGYPMSLLDGAMDPDGDGLINLREYKHGTNPFTPNADPVWSEVTGTAGAPFLSLVFPLVESRTDVTTSAKTSSELSGWTTTGVINENIGQRANQTWWRSKIPISGPAPAKGFLRLEFEK